MAPDEDFGTDPRVEAAKRLVVNKLLATGIQVCLRYPRDISTYFADMRNIGWHDDAILAQGPGGRDAGTFDKGGSHWRHGDLASSQKFTRNRIKGIRGGECCCDAGTVPSLDDLLEFVKEYRICYLNVEYPEVVFKQFRKGDEVIDKITAELKENGRVFATSLEKGGS
ncbi:hypothetical protein BC829DRAFT_79488 [Chytridium lagenaria]|nr:hypothetical protein BC829DRAFT_79488 [Chytridium lagenaria]